MKGRQEKERAGSQRRKDTSCLPMNGAPATEKGKLALDLLQTEVTSRYLIITLRRAAFLTLFSRAAQVLLTSGSVNTQHHDSISHG